MTRRAEATSVALLLLALAGAAPLRADRLHLEGGGVIEARSWWTRGDRVFYDNGSGSIAIPRAMVRRIEPTAGSVEPGDEAARPTPSARPAADTPAETETVQVTRDQHERLQRAREALEARDPETAAALYEALLGELDAEVTEVRFGYALSRMALGQDAMALSVVLDGLSRVPDQPQLLELLGDLRNREERVEEALAAWRGAFGQSPSDRVRTKILKAERELHAGRDYGLLRSSHFNLRHDGEVDAEVVEQLQEFLEQRYWDLARELSHAPPQPITVLLYPERQFRDVTQADASIGGIYDGKIRVPLGGLRRLQPAARALLSHELTHAVVHSKSRGHCPRWLHEGLAQRSEGRTLGPAALQAVRHKLRQGDAAQWESLGFSYPMALSLTSYLESRRGLTAVVDLLDRLGQGDTVDAALATVYGESYASLCRRWAEAVLAEVDP